MSYQVKGQNPPSIFRVQNTPRKYEADKNTKSTKIFFNLINMNKNELKIRTELIILLFQILGNFKKY